MEDQGGCCGEPAEQDGGKGHTEGATPTERVQRMHASVRGLVDQGGASEPLPPQHPKGCPSFIVSHEVGGEDTCFQFPAFPRQYSVLPEN